jgi:hypothetical protein
VQVSLFQADAVGLPRERRFIGLGTLFPVVGAGDFDTIEGQELLFGVA